jgi:type II secretory pathway component PulC
MPPLSPALPPEPTLTPNADNVIDLVAFVVSEKPGEPVNPFTVRTVPPEAMREVTLHVGGIVAGPMACAVINDRLVQVGEIIESLAVERIEPDAVLLRHSGRLLRLPVAEKSTRVRLPL